MPFGKVKGLASSQAPQLPTADAHAVEAARALFRRFASVAKRRELDAIDAAKQEAKAFAVQAGRKGGQSRSDKKRAAARLNGMKPKTTTRTLCEQLLGQRLTPEQVSKINLACLSGPDILLHNELNALLAHFGVERIVEKVDSKTWNRKTSARMPPKIRYFLQRFQHGARHFLSEMKEVIPKDYVVATSQRSREECEEWARKHRSIPCPPRRYKQYFRKLRNFHLLVGLFKDNPTMTAHDIEEWGGGDYAGYGEGIRAHLLHSLGVKPEAEPKVKAAKVIETVIEPKEPERKPSSEDRGIKLTEAFNLTARDLSRAWRKKKKRVG